MDNALLGSREIFLVSTFICNVYVCDSDSQSKVKQKFIKITKKEGMFVTVTDLNGIFSILVNYFLNNKQHPQARRCLEEFGNNCPNPNLCLLKDCSWQKPPSKQFKKPSPT